MPEAIMSPRSRLHRGYIQNLHYGIGVPHRGGDALIGWRHHHRYEFIDERGKQSCLLPELHHSDRPTKKLFTKLSEIDRTPPIPIIEDMVFAQSLVGITGASYAGKSFVALDMFLPVAVGSKYYDKQTSRKCWTDYW